MSLNGNYWDFFKRYVLSINPACEDDINLFQAIKFKTLVVRKGSKYQTEPLIPGFRQQEVAADA